MGVWTLLLFFWLTPTADAHPPQSAPNGDARRDAVPPAIDETIVVTATRSERAVSEVPVSTTVVREEEIAATPVRSVDDLLRAIPGIQPSVVSGSGSTPNNQRFSMRGLGGTRALVLLDGVPLHDPYSGIVQWQKVPLDTLRQVEVVRGGNASLFGNFALGGTVNLITRPVEKNDLTADVAYGTGATKRAMVTLDHVVNQGLSFRITHHLNDSNGFVRVPDPGPVDVPAWIDNAITAGRVEAHLTDRTTAFANASVSQIDISQGTPSTYSKRDVLAGSAGLHHGTGTSSLLSVTAFAQDQTERLVNSSIIGRRESEYVSQDGTIDSSSAGASVEWSTQLGGPISFLSFGVDVQQLEASENRTSFSRAGAVTQRNRVGGRQRFAGLYAQASWRPVDRAEILASARLDTFRNENGADVIEGGAATRYPDTSSTQLDPRVSLRYALGPHSAVRASAYRAFNAPTLRDLYRNNQTGNSVILGNPYLEPETLVGAEVGVEWALPRTHVEATLYRNTIDGVQSRARVPDRPPNIFRYENLGTSRSQGIELIADARLSRRWSIDAGYTFADSKIVEDPSPQLLGRMTPEVPRHSGSLAVRFTGDGGTSASVRGRVLGRSYGDAENLAVNPAHRVVDVSVSRALRTWIDAYATIENVFDEEYYLALTPTSLRSGLPRTVTAGVRMDLPAWRGR